MFLVDVGGDMGHDLQEFRTKYPDILGWLVLQDQVEVIAQIVQPLNGIELAVHDFFTPQPIKGKLSEPASTYELHMNNLRL